MSTSTRRRSPSPSSVSIGSVCAGTPIKQAGSRGWSSSSLTQTATSPSRSWSQKLEWVAGLVVGEGCFGTYEPNKGKRKNSKLYMSFAIGMYDHGAIVRVAEVCSQILGRPVPVNSYMNGPKTHLVYRVSLTGEPAVSIARALYPLMADTDKGRQIIRCFALLGEKS